jgi:hypothetical protein
MQNQLIPRWAMRLAGTLLIVIAIGFAWAIVAGVHGYALGSAPSSTCARTTRVDFVVPMWKAADPTDCGAAATAPPIPAGDSCDINAANYAGRAVCSWYTP